MESFKPRRYDDPQIRAVVQAFRETPKGHEIPSERFDWLIPLLDDAADSYLAIRERRFPAPHVQRKRLETLSAAIARLEAAIRGVHPAFWEIVAIEQKITDHDTRIAIADAAKADSPGDVIWRRLDLLRAISDQAEAELGILKSKSGGKGPKDHAPLHAFIRRFHSLYVTVTGRDLRSATKPFLTCLTAALAPLEPALVESGKIDSIARETFRTWPRVGE